jgi:uncharacterized membrane-anchored protein
MSRRRRSLFVALVAVQALVPLGFVAHSEIKLSSGHEVRFRTIPVDPLDIFRGNYVQLRYPFSEHRVPAGASVGDTVYVSLHRDGKLWSAGAATLQRPEHGTFIRGHITSTYGGNEAEIEYGIETHYADEKEALRLSTERLLVDVVLDDDGGARIARVSPTS